MIKQMTLIFRKGNYPHLDVHVYRATSYGVYISQRIWFARACSFLRISVSEIVLLLKSSSNTDTGMTKFYHRKRSLISKYKCYLKAFLRQGISHPEFYCDVIYKLRKIAGHNHFQFLLIKKIIQKGYCPTILLVSCATTRRS